MIVLKILLWIILIILALVLLAVLAVLFALFVKIQIGFDYDEDGVRLKLKYGFIPLKIYPDMFEPEKIEKYKNLLAKLKGVKDTKVAKKVVGVAQENVEKVKEKNDIKTEIKNDIEFKQEESRIAAEEVRVEAELKQAEVEYTAAVEAEEAGTPLPDIVKKEEISKLDRIKNGIEALDIPYTYANIKKLLSGFSFDSIVALLSYIGSKTGHTAGKVLRRIVIKQFCVGLTIGGDDAAKTAMKYGSISAVAFPAMGKLVSSAKVREYDLEMNPDFLALKDSGELHTIIAFRPLRLATPFIGYFVGVGGKSFSFYKSYKKTKKAKESEAD